jgi:hypothetical protein
VYRELARVTHLDRLAFTHCQPEAGCTVHFHDVTLTELGDFFNAGTAVVQNYRYPVRHCPIRRFFTVEYGQGEDAADFIATERADDCRASDDLRFFSFA